MGKFAVFHAMKGKGSGGQLGRHIDRMHQVANADPSRTLANRYVVMSSQGKAQILSHMGFHQRRESGQIKDMYACVNDRIKEGYQGKTAIRKDAVRYVNLMLSGSPEQMKEIERAGKLEAWMKHNYKFVRDEFGQDNVVRFAMHVDERTPHIHATVVPLTADGRLSAKEYLFGHKEKLRGFQNRYAKAMEPFGLERGLEGRRTRHTTTAEYYRNQEHATKIALPEIKPKERSVGLLGLGGKQEYYEVDKRSLDGFILAQKGQQQRDDRSIRMFEVNVSRTKQELKKSDEIANKLADLVDDRDKILKSVAEGKTSPQQIKEMFESYEKQQQQKQARKQEQQRNRGQGLSL